MESVVDSSAPGVDPRSLLEEDHAAGGRQGEGRQTVAQGVTELLGDEAVILCNIISSRGFHCE